MRAAFFLLFVCAGRTAYSQSQPERGIYPVRYDTHIHLTGTVNNSAEGCFVFDTGADRLCLDSMYLAINGLRFDRIGRATMGGAGNERKPIRVITEPLHFRFGSWKASYQATPIVQMKPLLGRYCDGIVGWDYFRGRIVELNYAGQYIRILKPKDIDGLEGCGRVPVTVRGERGDKLFVRGELVMPSGEKIAGEFLLDTGNGRAVSLTSVTARRYDLALIDNAVPYFTESGGLGGKSAGAFVRGGSFTIGGFTVRDPLVDYSTDTAGSLASGNYTGLLGNGILDLFDVIMDFSSMQLYLKPNGRYGHGTVRTPPRSGFGCVDRTDVTDGHIVYILFRDRNAHRVGLQLGDLITHIDDTALKTLRMEQVKEIFATVPERVTLTVVRGEETLRIELPLIDQGI